MIYLLYQDDGPQGICGQSMDITRAWMRLLEVPSPDNAYHLRRLSPSELSIALGFCGVNGSFGRENARITRWFSASRDHQDLWDCAPLLRVPPGDLRPTIVCLCGSTRFFSAFQEANLLETLAGRIVLTVGCDMKSEADLFADLTSEQQDDIKHRLDALHLRKIDLADEILVLNVDGYIGESTQREIEYAIGQGKRIRWWEESTK